ESPPPNASLWEGTAEARLGGPYPSCHATASPAPPYPFGGIRGERASYVARLRPLGTWPESKAWGSAWRQLSSYFRPYMRLRGKAPVVGVSRRRRAPSGVTWGRAR